VLVGRWRWGWLLLACLGTLTASGWPQDAPSPEAARVPIENLRAENVDVRRDAAIKISRADRAAQRAALPVLIDLLRDEKDGQVRLAVFDALTALGPDAEPAVPALVHTLRTDYGGQRLEETHQDYRAALALAAVGKPAVEELRGLLSERKENVRAEAAMGLGRIGPEAEPAVPALIKLLGDRSERVRREAAIALGRIGEAAVEPLIAASAEENADVRACAMEALGHLDGTNDRASAALLGGTGDAAPEVRAAALESLARLDLPAVVLLPVLRENLRHNDERVRLAAIELIVGRRDVLAALAAELDSLLGAEHEDVARHAAFLLGKLGPEAARRLLDALRREGIRVEPIAAALAQIGRPIAPLLVQALDDPEPRVRRGAALALGRIRPIVSGVEPKLIAGLGDPDAEVQAAYLTAIGELGPRLQGAVDPVRALLRDDSAAIRVQAIEILARSAARDERLASDLSALVDDPDPRVQRRAIDTLRALGPRARPALPVVLAKLRSPEADVRLAAAEWIGSHGEAAAEAVPALIDLLDDPAPELRTTAVQTLGKLGKSAQPAFDRLAAMLAAEPVQVREAAVSTLGNLGLDADVIRPHLARALRDGEPGVRRAALASIQRLGPQASLFVPDIILLAGREEDRGSAQRLLRRFERRGPDARALPELIEQLDHEQEAVRLLAVKFLGLAGRNAKDAIPALERLSADPSEEVREGAKAARAQIERASESPTP
jgi:HEAT repeat protein